MAKTKAKRLTKEAIAFIIECRDDPTQVYTWQEITDLVAEKFGIQLSFQAIAKSYHKHKDNIEIKPIIKQQDKDESESKKPDFDFKRIKRKSKSPLQGFNKTTGDDLDLKDLLATD